MANNVIKITACSKTYKLTELSPQKIHNLPCRIDYNGKANVSKCFDIYVNKSSDGSEMTGSLRGHPLTAKVSEVPGNYVGVFMKDMRNKSDGVREKIGVGKFKELTYWNWASSSRNLDNLQETYKLLDYTSVIHGMER